MRVYHSPGSRSTRVVWALEEAGASYEATVLTLDERRGEEHRTRHPLGRVPVIEFDDGQTMFESAAICLYLGDLFPLSGLVPEVGSPDRPRVLQWVLYAMTEVEPALLRWTRAKREGEDETEHSDRFAELAAPLESAIGDRLYIVGDRLTVADIILARILNIVRNELGTYRTLENYVDLALARPAHARAYALGRD
jgi:glutathione S-transferase